MNQSAVVSAYPSQHRGIVFARKRDVLFSLVFVGGVLFLIGEIQILWLICVLDRGPSDFCDLSHFRVQPQALGLELLAWGWSGACSPSGRKSLCQEEVGEGLSSGGVPGKWGTQPPLSSARLGLMDSEGPPARGRWPGARQCLSSQGFNRLCRESFMLLIRAELEGGFGLWNAGERCQVVRHKVKTC